MAKRKPAASLVKAAEKLATAAYHNAILKGHTPAEAKKMALDRVRESIAEVKKNPRRKRNSSRLVKLGKGYVVGLKVGRRFGYFTGSSIDTDKSRAHIYGSIEVAEKVGQAVANATGKRVVIREATRTRKRNPARAGSPQTVTGRETFRDTARAAKLFKEFTGDEPHYRQRVNVSLPKVALAIGSLDGVDYTTVRDGVTERYHHPFKRDARPALAVSPSGKQLLILGGRYTFTDRGIEDG